MDALNFPMAGELARRGRKTDAWTATRDEILEVDAANSAYPAYVSRAEGAYVWDVDGNRYIDFNLGYGPVVLGHAHPVVNAAVIEQLGRGTCASPMWSPRQVELTELLTEVIQADMAYLLRTGSDATAAAVRLARIHTGREMIARWGYNGWHDWCAPRPEGVPQSTLALSHRFAYNDIASLEELFARYPDQIACVVMMPYELEEPRPGFLNEVRETAHRHGALLILDEMRSGFRISLGGAQEYYGVRPDLSTFSKAMANGYPISAVVGRRDVMLHLGSTHMSSTFYGNPAEMAAAIATIGILRDTDALGAIWRMGESLLNGLRQILTEYAIPAEAVGLPISPFLRFDESAGRAKARFYQETLRRGVMFHPNHQWFLSAAHTDDDVAVTLDACRAAMDIVANDGGA
jgi:glutamate-1-semialdehyde 2,1-aminomutase